MEPIYHADVGRTEAKMPRVVEAVTVAPLVVLAEPTYKILSEYLNVNSNEAWNQLELQKI